MIARATGPVALATAGSVELPRPLLDRGAPLIPFGEPFQVEVHPGNTWQGTCGGGCGRVLKGNDSDFGSMVRYAKGWWCPTCVAKKRAEFVTQYLTLETCATCRMVTMSALLWEGLGCKKSHSGLRRCPQNNRGECMHSFDPFDVRAGNMSLTDPLGVRLEVPYNAIPPYLYRAGCAPKGIDLTLLPRREDLHPHHLHLVESGINFDPWAEGAASRLRPFTDMRDNFCWRPHPGYIPCRQMPFPESPLTGAIADEMDVDWSRRNVSIGNDGVVRGSMTQVPPPELQPETLADGTALIIGPSGTPRGTTQPEPRCVEVTTGDTGERLPEPRRAIPPGPPALLDPPLSTRETAEAIEKATLGRATLNLDSWFTLFRHLSKEEADDLANAGRIDGLIDKDPRLLSSGGFIGGPHHKAAAEAIARKDHEIAVARALVETHERLVESRPADPPQSRRWVDQVSSGDDRSVGPGIPAGDDQGLKSVPKASSRASSAEAPQDPTMPGNSGSSSSRFGQPLQTGSAGRGSHSVGARGGGRRHDRDRDHRDRRPARAPNEDPNESLPTTNPTLCVREGCTATRALGDNRRDGFCCNACRRGPDPDRWQEGDSGFHTRHCSQKYTRIAGWQQFRHKEPYCLGEREQRHWQKPAAGTGGQQSAPPPAPVAPAKAPPPIHLGVPVPVYTDCALRFQHYTTLHEHQQAIRDNNLPPNRISSLQFRVCSVGYADLGDELAGWIAKDPPWDAFPRAGLVEDALSTMGERLNCVDYWIDSRKLKDPESTRYCRHVGTHPIIINCMVRNTQRDKLYSDHIRKHVDHIRKVILAKILSGHEGELPSTSLPSARRASTVASPTRRRLPSRWLSQDSGPSRNT